MKVLLVEDEKGMAELLRKGLEEENHSVRLAFDGRAALELTAAHEFDVIVLDAMIPHIDGFEVARRLRRSRNTTPILMLTARDAVPDVVRGLDAGADDYLTKPFSFAELVARLRALGRRTPEARPTALRVADLVLDPGSHRVFRGRRELHLTATEFRLLEFLMRRAGRIASREAILVAVWGLDGEIQDNTLDAFVRLVRRKVDAGEKKKLIHTARGFGYSVQEETGS